MLPVRINREKQSGEQSGWNRRAHDSVIPLRTRLAQGEFCTRPYADIQCYLGNSKFKAWPNLYSNYATVQASSFPDPPSFSLSFHKLPLCSPAPSSRKSLKLLIPFCHLLLGRPKLMQPPPSDSSSLSPVWEAFLTLHEDSVMTIVEIIQPEVGVAKSLHPPSLTPLLASSLAISSVPETVCARSEKPGETFSGISWAAW